MRPVSLLAAALSLTALGVAATAQQIAQPNDEGEARAALVEARRQGAIARQRAEELERQAAMAGAAADRTARQAAAAAARIQETQAEVIARQADLQLIDRQREALRERLAQRQLPVVRLTAALQRLSRRPLAVSLLRPGSLRDTMHTRAVLATLLPEVQTRTAALRGEIDRSRELKAKVEQAVNALRGEQAELDRRRQSLAALETQQRLALRNASGTADRESERALALSEQARDLDALTAELGRAGSLRTALAALPGPVPRPANPQAAQAVSPSPEPVATSAGTPAFLLPVQGRLIAGFGASKPGTPVSRGVTLATNSGAQAVAPASGHVAFAGAYRGYGNIVIIDHGGGWTSLVTGLAQVDIHVGDDLLAGAPLGIAGPGRPLVTLELRRDGQPVNPLDFAKL